MPVLHTPVPLAKSAWRIAAIVALAPLLLGAEEPSRRIPPLPAEVGVRVEKPAGDGVHYSQGSGVLLGDGLVLTAAHVVKYNPQDPKVTVVMAGWRVDGTLAAIGGPDSVDLALVKTPRGADSDGSERPGAGGDLLAQSGNQYACDRGGRGRNQRGHDRRDASQTARARQRLDQHADHALPPGRLWRRSVRRRRGLSRGRLDRRSQRTCET